MASAVDSRLAYARLSAVATASRLPTANRGSNNSYTTSWDTTAKAAGGGVTHLGRDGNAPAPIKPSTRRRNATPCQSLSFNEILPDRVSAVRVVDQLH